MRVPPLALAVLIAATLCPAFGAAERHAEPRYATIERFGIRVELPPHAVLCGGEPLSATRELYILTVEGSRCDVRTPADIDVWLKADFNMLLEVYELPPIRRVIARHACQRTRNFEMLEFGEAPFRVADLPTFMCSGNIVQDGVVVGKALRLHFYRGDLRRTWPTEGPYPNIDYQMSVWVSETEFEQAKAALLELAKNAQLLRLPDQMFVLP